MNIKALKLSQAMIDSIMTGENGNAIMGNGNTLAALVTRRLITTSKIHHLTDLGHEVYAEITGKTNSRRLLAKCACGEPVRPGFDTCSLHAVYMPGLTRVVTAIRQANASEDHPTESDMITDADVRSHMSAITGTVDDGAESVVTHGWHCDMCELDSGSVWTVRALMIKDANDHFCGRDFATESLPQRIPGALLGESMDVSSWADNGLPGDAERIWDAENAEAERRDIESEYAAEIAEEMIAEIMTDDRLMHLTHKGVFVSQHYVNTMRRIGHDTRDSVMAWRSRQYESRLTMDDDFHVLDMMVEEGTMPYGKADRFKRIIRNTCRPSVIKGRKHKPSKNR